MPALDYHSKEEQARILTPITYEEYRALPRFERTVRGWAAEASRKRWSRTRAYADLRARLCDGSVPCARCGTYDDPTLDHRVPVILGGSHAPENIRVLCRLCNTTKRHRPESVTG